MIKVLVIGPFKGAIGGVNIHINRLIALLSVSKDVKLDGLNDGKGYSTSFPNLRYFEFIKILKSFYGNDIIHIHSSIWWLIILYITTGKIFRKKIIVTLHSWGYSPYQKKILLIFLKGCNKIISVNISIKDELSIKEKVVVQYAFLPPNKMDDLPLPQEILTKLSDIIKKGKRIIVGNAGQLFIYNSQDLYGLDLCIACARKFKMNNDPFFIIFTVSHRNEIAEKHMHIIIEEKLEDYIYLFIGLVSFPNLIKVSDLVVRPTNKDGDAITVREALFYNKPVLASNIIRRPTGVYLFKNRDWIDFYNQIKNVFNYPESSTVAKPENLNFKLIYEQIYLTAKLK